MKLKNILGIAISALLFTACAEDDPIGTLNGLTVDKTYALISTAGGNVTVTVSAASDWKLEDLYSVTATIDGQKQTLKYPLPVTLNKEKTAGVYSWLTVDKTSGAAGETVLTFSAPQTEGGREAEVCINMDGQKQFIMVRQGSLEATSATCADIIAAPDGKNFRLTAKITSWASNAEKYGNMWVSDGTGEIQLYGMADKDGKLANNPIASWGLELGDEITVEGPKSTYGTTVELVDVTVVKVTKALIQVITPDANFGVEGGELAVKVAYKGSGALFAFSEGAQSWINYVKADYIAGTKTIFEQNPADTVVFKFAVAANTGIDRQAVITFSSQSGKNVSQVAYNVKQEAFILPRGENPDDPFTVAEAIAKCQAIGSTSDGKIYYAKGKISSISSIDTGSYGNATFNISDDGTENGALMVYRSYSLDNKKFTAENEIAVGDEVVITGKLVNYKDNTPEFSGNVYILSIKKGDAPAEKGSEKNPFNIAEAIAFIDGGGTGYVYVAGIVSKIVNNGEFNAQYGNGSFWISDDGNFNDDPTKDFEAYRVYWLGNQKWVEGDKQIAVGDKVVLCGQLTKYKTTYETSQNKAFVFSVNGVSK